MDSLRIDKWLWAARFFKTRALASRACDLGRISVNGTPAKPAREIRPGDTLHIKSESGEFTVQVMALSAMRGPAAVAQTLFRETDDSRELRMKVAAERKALMNVNPNPERRPSKKERRKIIKFRNDL